MGKRAKCVCCGKALNFPVWGVAVCAACVERQAENQREYDEMGDWEDKLTTPNMGGE